MKNVERWKLLSVVLILGLSLPQASLGSEGFRGFEALTDDDLFVSESAESGDTFGGTLNLELSPEDLDRIADSVEIPYCEQDSLREFGVNANLGRPTCFEHMEVDESEGVERLSLSLGGEGSVLGEVVDGSVPGPVQRLLDAGWEIEFRGWNYIRFTKSF